MARRFSNNFLLRRVAGMLSALLVMLSGLVVAAGYQVVTSSSAGANGSSAPTFIPHDVSKAGYLYAITCTSATSCVAVGYDNNNRPLVISGNPAHWSGDPTTWTLPDAAHVVTLGSTFASGGYLQAITCTSATSCVAVGYDNNSRPLVISGNPAHWSGDPTTWSTPGDAATEVTLGSTFGSGGYLHGITCTSATSCVAVGYDNNSQPLVTEVIIPASATTVQTSVVLNVPRNISYGGQIALIYYGNENYAGFGGIVTGSGSAGRPLGTVTVYSGATALCSSSVTRYSGTQSYFYCSPTSTALSAGSYPSVHATYVPANPSSTNDNFAYAGSSSVNHTLSVGTVSVTFNMNAAPNSTVNESFTWGVAQALSANGFSRSGHSFRGWALSARGAIRYSDHQSITLTSPLTLYALWS